MTTRLVVRPHDDAGEDDWPWLLVNETDQDVWGDYPTEEEAAKALYDATHCTSCDVELDEDGKCWNPYCGDGSHR